MLIRRTNASQNKGVDMFVHGRLSVGSDQPPLMKVLIDRINELEVEEVPNVEVPEDTGGLEEINNNTKKHIFFPLKSSN